MKYFVIAALLAAANLSMLPADAAERKHPYRAEDRDMSAHRDSNNASILHAWSPQQVERSQQPTNDDWRNSANGS